MVLNARVISLDFQHSGATAVACADGRVLLVGQETDARALIGRGTEVVDAAGGLLVPGFHDAHLHLLSYARSRARLACDEINSLAELQARLRRLAAELGCGVWVRASGYDDQRLVERRHPDRYDLDLAVADHPVRLQHRSLHLDVLNTLALRLTGLVDSTLPEVERDNGEATGRVYHGAELLHARVPRPGEAELAADVRRASEQLLAWGVTSLQDATATNGPAEWQLFQRLAEQGHLRQRAWIMLGAGHVADIDAGRGRGASPSGRAASLEGGSLRLRAQCWPRGRATSQVRLGHAKVMLNEGACELGEVVEDVRAAHAAGWAVAVHAVSEAEVAMALAALREAGRGRASTPDRIEHGGVIADEWLAQLKGLGVSVAGQPALVHDRGDLYMSAYPPELHGWLHRAGSLLRAGVGYAMSSDAPLTQPWPGLGLVTATTRRTRSGSVLRSHEVLTAEQALAAVSFGPAQAAGVGHELGRLEPGALADFVVLDRDGPLTRLISGKPEPPEEPPGQPERVRLTVLDGRVVHRLL